MSKKTKIILVSFSIIATATMFTPFLTSCSPSNQFVFGNFQSYMSPTVKQKLDAKYKNINWQSFSSNNEIPTYLTNKTINAAVASNNMIVKLHDYQMISKIDWQSFGLINPKTNQVVKNPNDLNGIVSDLTYRISTEGFADFNINLLDYCLPYFLQNFVFVYRGAEIPELKNNPRFTDIMNVINKDERFLSNSNKPNVLMIKDSRTIYGLSQILDDESKNKEVNINPDNGLLNEPKEQSRTIQDLVNDYKVLKKSITNN